MCQTVTVRRVAREIWNFPAAFSRTGKGNTMRTSKRTGLFAGLLAMVLGAALGQSDAGPKFEIADIHTSAAGPAGQNQFMRGGFYRGGRYEVRTATMVDLIRT